MRPSPSAAATSSASPRSATFFRLIGVGLGVILIGYGMVGYAAPGALQKVEYWWIACVGLALALASGLLFSTWRTAGMLAGLFVAGFAAQLAMKDPFWFQHVRILPTRFSALMLIMVGLQGGVSGLYLLRRGILSHLGRIGQAFGWLRLCLVFAVLVVASKPVMEFVAFQDPMSYARHQAVALAFLICNLMSLLAFVMALPAAGLARISARFDHVISLPGTATALTPWDRRLPYISALFVFLLTAAISYWSFDGIPHLDGIVYLFHARYFADGMLSLPAPDVVEAFSHYLMDVRNGQWFSVNLPGWPLALVPGIWTGLPWLINPVLAGLSVLLLHRFLRVQSDRGIANLAVLLLAVSPWYLSISSTFLIHTFSGTLVLGSWVLLQNARKTPGVVVPFLAGCLMGWLFLSRPLEGLYMGVLTGLWVLSFLKDQKALRIVVSYSLGCLAVGGLLFVYNAHLTGSPLSLPMTAYLDVLWGPGRNAIGFGPEIGAPDWGNVDVFAGHSPLEALINFQQSLYELNSELFGWAGASIFFALIFFLYGRWNRLAVAMGVILLATLLLYALYWYVGGFYTGPRYWFMGLVPMVVFSVFGLMTFVGRLGHVFPGAMAGTRITLLVGLLGIGSILIFESWVSFNKYPGINGFHTDYLTMSRQEKLRNALVFIRSDRDEEFGSAFWINDFHPEAETPLFARDLGPETNRLVAASYPDRPVFLVDGPSEKVPQVVVREGPISLVPEG